MAENLAHLPVAIVSLYVMTAVALPGSVSFMMSPEQATAGGSTSVKKHIFWRASCKCKSLIICMPQTERPFLRRTAIAMYFRQSHTRTNFAKYERTCKKLSRKRYLAQTATERENFGLVTDNSLLCNKDDTSTKLKSFTKKRRLCSE